MLACRTPVVPPIRETDATSIAPVVGCLQDAVQPCAEVAVPPFGTELLVTPIRERADDDEYRLSQVEVFEHRQCLLLRLDRPPDHRVMILFVTRAHGRDQPGVRETPTLQAVAFMIVLALVFLAL